MAAESLANNVTRLSDAIVPHVYLNIDDVDEIHNTEFYQSGVIKQTPLLDNLARSPGDVYELDYWNDLDSSSRPNVSSDDPDIKSKPEKITSGRQLARAVRINKSYAAADLVNELAFKEPMTRIRSRFSAYWTKAAQDYLMCCTSGLIAGNVTYDDGDMGVTIAKTTAGIPDETNLFSLDAFFDSVFTLGDAFESLNAIAMHSWVYKRLVKKNEIETIRPADGSVGFRAYKGYRVIVSDRMPTKLVDGNVQFTSVLYGAGVFGYGQGLASVPVETKRDPDAGNGGGLETIYERKTWLLHPGGYQIQGEPVINGGFNYDEVLKAETWKRVFDRKALPLAYVVSN